MASRNDYLVLDEKCRNLFSNIAVSMSFDECKMSNLSNTDLSRFGFYYLVLQNITDLEEYDDITEVITDTDFNSKLFNVADIDEGIDAAYIDDDNHNIMLFNFKYRNKYDEDKTQSLNELLASSKFFNAIANSDVSYLKGKIKSVADRIIERYNGTQLWNTSFYYVTNENVVLKVDDPHIKAFANQYDIKFDSIGLDRLVDIISIHPQPVSARFKVAATNIISYVEDEISSNKSYVVRMTLPELIRITCNDDNLRNNLDYEGSDSLTDVDIELDVLYENVRGFILKSKFNDNIRKTLEMEPNHFFYYNNGITIIAENISSTATNLRKSWLVEVSNFQVVNGGQTLRTIHKYNREDKEHLVNNMSKAEILVRFLRISDQNLKNRIGEYTNSQNAINLADLRSLRAEQICLEQYLKENRIHYIRKIGDTGDSQRDVYSIGKERLGQILLATRLKSPELTSNKKREIFNTYYDKLFVDNSDLLSKKTVEYILKYKDIDFEYKKSEYSGTIQKIMYILYLEMMLNVDDHVEMITKFEKFLSDYAKSQNKDLALSRYLITPAFREALEKYFRILRD
jgi:hypothetical protein